MTALRKHPTQDRSKQRVERIVDAATRVFAEAGYEAATTEAIASRAGVSIGSLYQFFPNKRALMDAVSHRYYDEIRVLFEALTSTPRPWNELLDETIDGFWLFHKTSPGFQAIYKSFMLSPDLLASGDALNREIARRLADVIERYSRIEKKHREIVATLVVETISTMLLIGGRMKEPRASGLIAETKIMLQRYLAPYVSKKT